jgi:hypothetical protein
MSNKRIMHVIGYGYNNLVYVNGTAPEEPLETQKVLEEIISLESIASQKPRIWKGNISNYTYFCGFLSNVDKKQRQMSFSYCIRDISIENARKLLDEDLSTSGYTLSPETKEIFEKKNSPTLVSAIIVFIILLLLTLVIILL